MKTQQLPQPIIDSIATKVLSMLEAGTAPWQKPWNADGTPLNPLSKDYRTGKPGHAYQGNNVLLLGLLGIGRSRFWTGPSQAIAAGGDIKGAKTVAIYRPLTRTVDDRDNPGKKKSVPLPGRFTYTRVINWDEVRGLDHKILPEWIEERTFEPIPKAESIVKSMVRNIAPIRHGGNRACYSPSSDQISMPERGSFFSPEDYYSTLFHEAVHSTGHVARISRPGITDPIEFGSHAYSAEELVAEFGACFLSSQAGIAPSVIENSAAYLASWHSKIAQDPAILASAILEASQAYNWTQGNHAIQRTAAKAVA